MEEELGNLCIRITKNRFYYLNRDKSECWAGVTSKRMRQNPFVAKEVIALEFPYFTANFFAVIYMNGHGELNVCVMCIL